MRPVCCAVPDAHSATSDPCLCADARTQAALRRIEADISRRQMIGGLPAVLGFFAGFGLAPQPTRAQPTGRPVLLTNLRLFDGEARRLRNDVDVLIQGDRIGALPARAQGPAEAERIDCGGRVVMPGLIDTHWHATLVGVSMVAAMTQEPGLVHLLAAREAGATLRRGFTTVRDVGGPAFALKTAIDRGIVEGPRIFPSGAMISQTSGHGDFRFPNVLPAMPSDPAPYAMTQGVASIADGVPAMLQRVREQLMKGASQIKLTAGGGVASMVDPLLSTQFTAEEIKAAVDAADDWETYVCAHVYTSRGIRRCVNAGVRCIEHGHLVDEDTVRLMADRGTWWSIQPFLMDEDANPKTDPEGKAAQQSVSGGTERAFGYALKHKVNWAFGTDILFTGSGASQGRQLAKLARYMPPLEALHRATGAAGKMIGLSGPRGSYGAPLGVIAPGAMADLLVIDGEPERELAWLDNPDNLRLIVKGGRVHKRTL